MVKIFDRYTSVCDRLESDYDKSAINREGVAYLGRCVKNQLEFLRDLGQEVNEVWSQRGVDCHETAERRGIVVAIVQQIV